MKILTDIRKCSIFLAVILLLIGLLSGKIHLFVGLFVGCMLSILNFHGLSMAAQKIVQINDKKSAITFVIVNYMAKLAVITIILVIAIKISLLAFVGVLTGLMTINVAILLQAFRFKTVVD
ncbi:MAG: ATP synthase subunit I [Candidatus Desantisbacteria bacterium]